ncbi:MAG: DUF4157 domain-containing protein, partial [bacterium]|nr:DUF4157 domain-containing protein [bacterium]
TAAKPPVKATQERTQSTLPADVPVITGIAPLIQQESLCPCDGGCPRCAGGSADRQVQSLQGGGKPLPQETRSFFETRFSRQLDQVKVHTDTRAAEAAKMLHARAFTMGQDIAFAPGFYAPGTAKGKRLLAHELTHTIQK